MQFVGFRLDDQEYAFRIEQIQEIIIPDRVTRMPQVPDYVEGVSNLRGTIVPIINLRRLFGMQPKVHDEDPARSSPMSARRQLAAQSIR